MNRKEQNIAVFEDTMDWIEHEPALADTVQDMFPVWIPLTAVFVIAVGLFVFKLYLESARKKRRRRRQRRRSEEDK